MIRLFALLAALSLAAPVQAQALRVFAGGAVTPTSRAVGADYTARTGRPVEVVSGTTGVLSNQLKAGEKADVVVLAREAIEALRKDGLVRPEGFADVARAVSGLAVRKGAKAPDLSTMAAFKATLLAAKSVSYVDPKAGGTSGAYFEGLVARMGIADQIKAKTVYRRQGSEVAAAVAAGEAEVGVSFISELAPNPGVTAQLLPAEVQNPTVYSAAVTTSTSDLAAAEAFIAALRSPAGAAVIRKAFLEPLAP